MFGIIGLMFLEVKVMVLRLSEFDGRGRVLFEIGGDKKEK